MEAAWALFEHQRCWDFLFICDTDTVFKNAAARRRPRLQGRQREAEKKQREGGREGAKPDWMVAAARSQALAGQTWLSGRGRRRRATRAAALQPTAVNIHPETLNPFIYTINGPPKQMIESRRVESLVSLAGMVVKEGTVIMLFGKC